VVSTKQFTIFFLLVVVFLVAIMIVTSFAWREAGTTYDTTSIRASLIRIVDFSAFKIGEQEAAMRHWVFDVDRELHDVEGQISYFQTRVDSTIYTSPTPPPAP
jgi:hypothetical protein